MPQLERFDESAIARELHTQGLQLCKTDYEAAHDLYTEALDVLTSGNHNLDEPSLRMQSSRIVRDDGFTYVRRGITQPAELETGFTKLRMSEGFLRMLKDRGHQQYKPEAWRFLLSEYGATLGLLGRLATAAYVVSADIDIKAFELYDRANDDLKKGSNRYYETSNAINAARHSVVVGQLGRVSMWRDRSWRSVEAARKTDKPNYRIAKSTFDKRKKFLKNQTAAIKSVKTDP